MPSNNQIVVTQLPFQIIYPIGAVAVNIQNDFIQFNAGTQGLLLSDASSETTIVSDGQTFTYNAAGMQIAGTQVLTTQQAAVANATTAADVITRFNELLARLRASTGHGLIAG